MSFLNFNSFLSYSILKLTNGTKFSQTHILLIILHNKRLSSHDGCCNNSSQKKSSVVVAQHFLKHLTCGNLVPPFVLFELKEGGEFSVVWRVKDFRTYEGAGFSS